MTARGESKDRNASRKAPYSDEFKKFIVQGWAPYPTGLPALLPAAEHTAGRRQRITQRHAGHTLVVPAVCSAAGRSAGNPVG